MYRRSQKFGVLEPNCLGIEIVPDPTRPSSHVIIANSVDLGQKNGMGVGMVTKFWGMLESVTPSWDGGVTDPVEIRSWPRVLPCHIWWF